MSKAQPNAIPTLTELLATLEAKGTPGVKKIYLKQGAGDKVFGVKMGDLRALAKPLKQQHALGLELWDSGWYEAQILATLLLDPKQLSESECIRLAESCEAPMLLDKLTDYVLAESKHAEALRARWIDLDAPMLGRAGWNLMTAAVKQDKQGALDLDGILAKVETELPAAPTLKKQSMNECLVMIGVFHAGYTDKALAAGERLGRWDDRPVPKGCYSSYPPEWIPAAIALRKRR